MPWSRGPVDERRKFIELYATRQYSITELCAMRGISRACAHKWIRRWKEYGESGLEELSRTPHHSPNQIGTSMVQALLALKAEYPSYGPVTLVDMLADRDGNRPMAPSTAGRILERHGLVRRRGRRRYFASGAGERVMTVPGPGHTMTADYKGQFRLGNGQMCYPLTILDPASRYLLAVEPLTGTNTAETRRVFERVFRQWGVPEQILTDNGVPFCNRRGVGGLTSLSKWWIDLGATPVRIDPGKPQQNGTHERMHLTFDHVLPKPPQPNFKHQRQLCERFRYEYNIIRPHRALEGKPPAAYHRSYSRPYSHRIAPPEYPAHFEVRRVRSNGQIKWMADRFFLTEVLIGENVALEQVTETEWDVWYRHLVIGTFDALLRKIIPAKDRP